MIGRYYLDDFDPKLDLQQKIILCKNLYLNSDSSEITPKTVYLHPSVQDKLNNITTISDMEIKFGRFVPKNVIWIGVEIDNPE